MNSGSKNKENKIPKAFEFWKLDSKCPRAYNVYNWENSSQWAFKKRMDRIYISTINFWVFLYIFFTGKP